MNTGQKKGWEIKGEVTLSATGCAKQIGISNGVIYYVMHGISTALGVYREHACYIWTFMNPLPPKSD